MSNRYTPIPLSVFKRLAPPTHRADDEHRNTYLVEYVPQTIEVSLSEIEEMESSGCDVRSEKNGFIYVHRETVRSADGAGPSTATFEIYPVIEE